MRLPKSAVIVEQPPTCDAYIYSSGDGYMRCFDVWQHGSLCYVTWVDWAITRHACLGGSPDEFLRLNEIR